ncbi:metal ABC transporter permease [Tuwongella immobilis]|uniref:Metal ABC transporter permease n=1 Tax=Tuwongella immobilis TaxID=692036 RepID=A0A6C2YPK5_9BACT|nr:metal ABC transporter permease [Tuwongella immobilis]VIP03119.1 abc transporter : ABC-type Mn2+/Zn2+ transport system, permease component OS=Desulfosporosinus orientis (strain ATCC 19365 / DSM 765 / NCIMB 8382 / VKM B-1628) GN=Desor_0477 PE=3 SV=1: ABC-3 [Tuwongella immobilis]VTS03445.1 abc transporter : ABC-type Mn2+/Zn2+ transport system, permease component OS=Desulfosporosinus orientis (strain ATCC 19365 / DSM 765 / NCIMB 8382 / VKM B-1628) GN=Desor_0477 PE=3 SV=1: ABC-3 [Tuwongella immobil
MTMASFITLWIEGISSLLGILEFEVRAFLTVGLVCLICGLVGAMVMANRMAFFSDAMAHCSFAGVALGMLTVLMFGYSLKAGDAQDWLVPLVMVLFSVLIGFGIAWVRERTNLATDAIIGVFFAGAMGFGALLLTALRNRSRFDPEGFLFGNPWVATDIDLFYLLILLGFTTILMIGRQNSFLLSSFNQTLAKSRGTSTRINQYLFIVLLALIVNFSLRAVGVLLINGLIIVPAASAANIARNIRELYLWSIGLSVTSGLGGLLVSSHLKLPMPEGPPLEFGPSGPILLIAVFGFFFTLALAANRAWNERFASGRSNPNTSCPEHPDSPNEPFCLH